MYLQITIQANEKQQDELIALLSDFNSNGFEQNEKELIAFFNANDFNDTIPELIKEFQYEIKSVEEQNWNAFWESNFQPVVVDDFCAIRAHFHPSIASVQHEIIITPKMSFGTGHHATTYMMIRQMWEINFKNKVVFDFGTGTGVLAILAEKCGASNISAIDVDEWSIRNAQENMERNNCSKISLSLTSQIPDKKFDVVLANINRNVILQYLFQIKNSILINGYLLLSGLMAVDEEDIIRACSHLGFKLEKKTEKDNWILLFFSSH